MIPAVSCMRSSRPVDDRWSHRLYPAFPGGFRWNLVSGPTFTPGMWFLFPLAELGQITWGGADTRRGIRDVLALPVVDVPVGLCDRGLSALSLPFELTLPRLVPLWTSETARRAEASSRFFSRKAEQLDKPVEGARSGQISGAVLRRAFSCGKPAAEAAVCVLISLPTNAASFSSGSVCIPLSR